ncbi:hypothetical protein F4779DRAFT_620524 [Xylariaceae sp. FL0662B]|nr:hypothetical protein F4779DRAFT_620524 [Xylariaceae sp. FL0662B]
MSAAFLEPSGAFKAPDVSQAEMDWFHEAHFSNVAAELFGSQFLQPENVQYSGQDQYDEEYDEYYEEEEEDDGLGYYSDGVKRTLTDEQIAIFRHSEIEALRRAETKAAKLREDSAALLQAAEDQGAAKSGPEPTASLPVVYDSDALKIDTESISAPPEIGACDDENEMQDGSEDGEIETERPQLTKAQAKRLKRQRAKKRKQERKFNPEKKPDLRKRTWDVVEAGMDSLDYGELEDPQDTAANPVAQRRRISYDD